MIHLFVLFSSSLSDDNLILAIMLHCFVATNDYNLAMNSDIIDAHDIWLFEAKTDFT